MAIVLTRLPNWPALLQSFLCDNQHRPFQYGSWDCCLFVCDAIQIMTGTDIAKDFRGRYFSRKEAFEAIREYAGTASVQAVSETVALDHQMPEIPILQAHRGDMALLIRGRDYSLGLIDLNGKEVIHTSPKGLWRVPLSFAVRAWSV